VNSTRLNEDFDAFYNQFMRLWRAKAIRLGLRTLITLAASTCVCWVYFST